MELLQYYSCRILHVFQYAVVGKATACTAYAEHVLLVYNNKRNVGVGWDRTRSLPATASEWLAAAGWLAGWLAAWLNGWLSQPPLGRRLSCAKTPLCYTAVYDAAVEYGRVLRYIRV